jgi:hypothetical protein
MTKRKTGRQKKEEKKRDGKKKEMSHMSTQCRTGNNSTRRWEEVLPYGGVLVVGLRHGLNKNLKSFRG